MIEPARSRDFQVTKSPVEEWYQKLTLLVEKVGVYIFISFGVNIFCFLYSFWYAQMRAPFFYCLFAFVLIFYCFCVFSVYWDNLIEMKCNEIAFRWNWYNMNVTTTLVPDSWLGILNWMTWFGWLGLVTRRLAGRMMSRPKELSLSCFGSWQEVDRHMRLGNVDKQGEMQTTDSSWYSLTPTSWASTSTPQHQQGLKKSGCFLLRWHLPSEIDQ